MTQESMTDDTDYEIERSWVELGNKHWRATIESSALDRKIVHEYLATEYEVVEVDKLFESGKPQAVFTGFLDSDDVDDPGSVGELESTLKGYAFDGEHLQLTDEFEASREVFETE